MLLQVRGLCYKGKAEKRQGYSAANAALNSYAWFHLTRDFAFPVPDQDKRSVL
jgi:hypothetical protein